jgi:transposase
MQASEVAATSTSSMPVVPMNRGARAGFIELEIAGARLCLRGAVDEASLCSVLRALRQST